MDCKHAFFAMAALAGELLLAATPQISGLTVRQRWPWEAKVDIDFTLGAGDPSDVDLTATYDGCTNSLNLGTLARASAGTHHVVFDPADYGLTNAPLTNFRVTANVGLISDRTFLELDLKNNVATYHATKPTMYYEDQSVGYGYHNRKMLFRRVAAGTYPLGYSGAMLNVIIPNDGETTTTLGTRRRTPAVTTTLTSDYYISVYKVTAGHHAYLCDDSTKMGNVSTTAQKMIDLRGKPSEGWNWPTSGFAVADDSLVKTYRARIKDLVPHGWILDLPTGAQLAVAQRAGESTDHFWSIPSEYQATVKPCDATATTTDMTNTCDAVAIWAHNSELFSSKYMVGQRMPNAWGLYDTSGLNVETYIGVGYGAYFGGTDPTGTALESDTANGSCLAGSSADPIRALVPGEAYGCAANLAVAFRLVLNTRNWLADK